MDISDSVKQPVIFEVPVERVEDKPGVPRGNEPFPNNFCSNAHATQAIFHPVGKLFPGQVNRNQLIVVVGPLLKEKGFVSTF